LEDRVELLLHDRLEVDACEAVASGVASDNSGADESIVVPRINRAIKLLGMTVLSQLLKPRMWTQGHRVPLVLH
jgi:hypothetical protein